MATFWEDWEAEEEDQEVEEGKCRVCGQPDTWRSDKAGYCEDHMPVIAVDMPYGRYPAHVYYYIAADWLDIVPGDEYYSEQCPGCGISTFEVTESGRYLKCVGQEDFDPDLGHDRFYPGCGEMYPLVEVENRKCRG